MKTTHMPINMATTDYYIPTKYPESGIYGPVSGGYYFVAKTCSVVSFVSEVAFNEISRQEPTANITSRVVTADDILKAIAISLHPDLAVQLIK